ncbi:MAG: galactokinase [Chloroflexi bacterium]|nr:galactokinase [Chloroflexota bacterium]
MIITRSPLRITLGGGGTDLPSYYQGHGGFLIAAAVDKYVYITIHETFVDDLIVKYSQLERVPSAEQVEHPIFREALKLLGIDGRSLEISSMADIPAGTGLGSSGSFTTALLKALHTHRKHLIHPRELAEQACHIEIDLLREEIGKQDQYIAAFGGLTCFEFQPDGRVEARPLGISTETLYTLEDNLLLFFTGYSRSASQVLQEQNRRSLHHDPDVERNLTELKEIAYCTRTALEAGDLRWFAELLSAQWDQKKRRTGGATNTDIDRWHTLALASGALGGKLVGAGGGGFLMFYAEDKTRLRRAMAETGLREVRFRFDFEGTKVAIQ